jgi:hypothetical protein
VLGIPGWDSCQAGCRYQETCCKGQKLVFVGEECTVGEGAMLHRLRTECPQVCEFRILITVASKESQQGTAASAFGTHKTQPLPQVPLASL